MNIDRHDGIYIIPGDLIMNNFVPKLSINSNLSKGLIKNFNNYSTLQVSHLIHIDRSTKYITID